MSGGRCLEEMDSGKKVMFGYLLWETIFTGDIIFVKICLVNGNTSTIFNELYFGVKERWYVFILI